MKLLYRAIEATLSLSSMNLRCLTKHPLPNNLEIKYKQVHNNKSNITTALCRLFKDCTYSPVGSKQIIQDPDVMCKTL